MSRLLKFLFVILVTVSLVTIVYCAGFNDGFSRGERCNPELFEYTHNLFKTAAHIDLSDKEQYKQIYVDEEHDIAYYMYLGERKWIKPTDTVYFYDGTASVVHSTDVYGFLVEDVPSVTFGFSGSAVLDADGNQIGYVSERLSNGYIYCIWI